MQLNYTAPRSARRVDSEYIRRLREAAQGRWHSLLIKLGVPAEVLTGEVTRCPECGGAFRFLDTRERGEFVCRGPHRSDVTGDGFALVAHLGGLNFGQAIRVVGEALELREMPTMPVRPAVWSRGVV
jgi:phage/plasmid primase-like uncharacterized protein